MTRRKISIFSTKFVFFFFWPIGKPRWPPRPLNGCDIFEFFSVTAIRNSAKLDRKQDLNALYRVCVLRDNRRKQMWPPRPLIVLEIFDFYSENDERNLMKLDRKQELTSSTKFFFFGQIENSIWPSWPLIGRDSFNFSLNGIWQNMTRIKISMSSTKFVFFEPIRKPRWPPRPLIGWEIFYFSLETAERNSMKLDRKQNLYVLYEFCGVFFREDKKTNMAGLASDWLGYFQLLLWMEFDETWKEARSQCPLSSLSFSGRSENQEADRPLFDFSSETAEQNWTKDLSLLYQLCIFGADRETKMFHHGLWMAETFRVLLCNR